jgi:nucleotide-binding universal stress UspA family protein
MGHDARPPVLIGYDGYDDAAVAVRGAGRLLAPRRAIVACVWESLAARLLHSDVEELTGAMREAAEEFDAGESARARETCTAGAALADEAGFEAQGVSARGNPKAWPTLLSIADEHHAAAIVIGSEGIGAVRSALFGSVAGGLLHHSKRPLLIVPTEPETPDGPVLFGYDGSAHAQRAIEVAGGLLAGRPAIVSTVWTSYEAVVGAGDIGIPAAMAAAGAERLDAELAKRASRTAEEGAAAARAAGFDARGEALREQASIGGTLMAGAREHGAVALALGTRGRSRVSAMLLGSVAAGVLHRPSVPLLVA